MSGGAHQASCSRLATAALAPLPAQRCRPPGKACRPGGALYGHAPYGYAPHAMQQQPVMPPPLARARAPVQPSADISPAASNSGDSDFSIDSELTRRRLRSAGGNKKGGGGGSKRSAGGSRKAGGGGATPRKRDRACVADAGRALGRAAHSPSPLLC